MGMHASALQRGLVSSVLIGVAACSSAPSPAPPPGPRPSSTGARQPPSAPPASSAFAPGFGRVFSERFGLSIPLPDPDAWQLRHERSSFLVLDHVPTKSQLVVRLWRETENMNRQRCEQQARLRRDLPTRDGAETISHQPIDVPPEFDTMVDVGLAVGPGPGWARGHVLAFGGWARRCFAFVYTTETTGPQAEQVVAERLAVMHERSLGGIEVRSATDPLPPSR